MTTVGGQPLANAVGEFSPVSVDEVLRLRLRETERELAQEHAVASLLQRVLVPDSLERIEGVDVAARYHSASSAARVGGDWFDVVRRGKASEFAMFVGDVAGHGVASTEAMVQFRQWGRLLSIDVETPSQLLRRLNGAARRFIDREMATALVAFVDLAESRLTWATAGHPPLVVVDRSGKGTIVPHDSIGPPLGVGDRWEGRDQVEQIDDVEAIAMYTDGLIERRGEVLDEGLGRLATALSGASGSAARRCATVMEQLFDPTERNDDACIVMARRVEPQPTGEPIT